MKVAFLGSSEFSEIVLSELIGSSHEVTVLVCKQDAKSGRGQKLVAPQIKQYAQSLGIKVLQFDNVNEHIDQIMDGADLFVTASFGQILSRKFVEHFGLNVHPSLLPKYRGATPLQTALLCGDKQTGVSVQKMRYEVDSGEIFLAQKLDILDDDDYVSLSQKAAELGGKLLVKVLDGLENKTIKAKKQKGKVSFTKLIKKEDGLLNFNDSAKNIVNKIRALGHNPGCYFLTGGERIKVQKARICTTFADFAGKIKQEKRSLFISANDFYVEILTCQAPGGKMLDVKDFLNGYKFKGDKVDAT